VPVPEQQHLITPRAATAAGAVLGLAGAVIILAWWGSLAAAVTGSALSCFGMVLQWRAKQR
jgi:hypothetical protein